MGRRPRQIPGPSPTSARGAQGRAWSRAGLHRPDVRVANGCAAIRRERPPPGRGGPQNSAAMQAPMGRRSPPRWRVRNACTAMPTSNLVPLLRARYPTEVQGHRRRDVGRWLLRRHVRVERAPYGCPPNRQEGRRAVHRGRLSGSPTEGTSPPRRGDLHFHPGTNCGIWRPRCHAIPPAQGAHHGARADCAGGCAVHVGRLPHQPARPLHRPAELRVRRSTTADGSPRVMTRVVLGPPGWYSIAESIPR